MRKKLEWVFNIIEFIWKSLPKIEKEVSRSKPGCLNTTASLDNFCFFAARGAILTCCSRLDLSINAWNLRFGGIALNMAMTE